MSLILSGTDGLSDVDGSAATPAIRGTDANTGIFFPAADTVGVSTGGSERMRVDSSGRVGIGTIPSAWTLAANFEVGAASVVGNSANAYFSANQYYDGAWKYKADGFGSTLLQTNGNFDFYTAPTGLANATATQTLRVRIAPDGNFQFNSGYGSVATAYGCRAWVNFNGTGTVAIRASGNVSSITDNGTGDYTVNFTTAMSDANYAASGGCGDDGTTNDRILSPVFNNTPTTSALRTRTTNNSGTPLDVGRITLQIIR